MPSRAYSRSTSPRRLAISSTAPTCDQMSPTVCSGVRTLVRISDSSVSSGRPSRSRYISGMWKPSSNSSRASTDRILPPMSGTWAAVAAKPTSRSPAKTGLTRQMSLRWPVPIQGLLVMNTSPGRMRSAPICASACRTVRGRVPMKDGMLPLFSASARPAVSVTTTAKSFASVDSVEKDVRTISLAASSAMERTRVQNTSRKMGSAARRTPS